MTREEAINRWKDIVSTVFWAEEAITKEWYAKLREAPNLNKKEQHELAEAYFRAIAVEITKNTPDEELAEME